MELLQCRRGGNIWVVCQDDCLDRKQLPMIKNTESRLRASSCWAGIIAGCPSWAWLQLLQLQNVLVLGLVVSYPEKYLCSVHLELLCGAAGQWPPGSPWLMAVACSKWNYPTWVVHFWMCLRGVSATMGSFMDAGWIISHLLLHMVFLQ